jgi:methionyl-tRNA formyltransferase
MKIVLASSSLLTIPIFAALRQNTNHEVIGFISTPDQAKGRSGRKTPNEFSDWAEKEFPEISLEKPLGAGELSAILRKWSPDLVIAIAYGKLIGEEAISLPKFGWINLHFSLLPKWRGAAPVQRSILALEKTFGISIFQIDQGLDTGPIFIQNKFSIDGDQCATEILSFLSLEGSKLIGETLDLISSGFSPTPQRGESSLAPKIEKKELKLNLSNGIALADAQIRAFTQAPGVWFLLKNKRHIITSARKSHRVLSKAAIAVIEESLFIGTGDGSIEVLSLIPEGSREMQGGEYARGARIEQGALIEE